MLSSNKILSALLLLVVLDFASATITVSIGNGLRISTGTQTRYRDNPYKCYWDCDLVGCGITRYDDECAYDCEKVCRSRYDYVGRSDPAGLANLQKESNAHLQPKSSDPAETKAATGNAIKPNPTVRLYMPRNATIANFGIWESCPGQENTL